MTLSALHARTKAKHKRRPHVTRSALALSAWLQETSGNTTRARPHLINKETYDLWTSAVMAGPPTATIVDGETMERLRAAIQGHMGHT